MDSDSGHTNVVNSTPARPIRVRVGYPWTLTTDGTPYVARSDARWKAIRDIVKPAFKWIETYNSKRHAPPQQLEIDFARLRGTHGQFLLENLKTRISDADILILDIGTTAGDGLNPNVLLECGLALGLHMEKKNRIFILKPTTQKTPSDLNGFLFTEYDVDAKSATIQLNDKNGFVAALRSTILAIARERHMIGESKAPSFEDEDETVSPEAADSRSAIKP